MVSVFLGQDSGLFIRFEDFRNLVSRDSVLVFRTWMVSDFSEFGFRGYCLVFRLDLVVSVFSGFGFFGFGFELFALCVLL